MNDIHVCTYIHYADLDRHVSAYVTANITVNINVNIHDKYMAQILHYIYSAHEVKHKLIDQYIV